MDQRGGLHPMWWGTAIGLTFAAVVAVAYVSQDEPSPHAMLSSYGHVEPAGRTPNPGALAAATLLFGCSGPAATKCWDIARSEMREETITSMYRR